MNGNPCVTIINLNKNKGAFYDVYIGRSNYTRNLWRNDYVIGINGTRSEVIKKFERKLLQRIVVTRELTYWRFTDLIGKILACHCVPKRCHGEVIAFYVKLAATHDEQEFTAICNVRYNSNITGGFDKCY